MCFSKKLRGATGVFEAILEFRLLSLVPLLDGTEIPHDTRVHFRLLVILEHRLGLMTGDALGE